MIENNIVVESLKDQVGRLEQETRMIIPGIQALFGFQLVAAFNNRFTEFSEAHQMLHWMALALTAVAMMLAMAPAAFHRQAEPDVVSERLVRHANRWITMSLVPLMVGICIDFYLIGIIVNHNQLLSVAASLALLCGYIYFWFLFPILCRRPVPKVDSSEDD